jgi:hypothetical protein
MITTVRRELCYRSSFQDIRSPPFGKTRARNFFKDFCVGGNNINDPNEVTKVFVLSPTIFSFLKCVHNFHLLNHKPILDFFI